MKRLLPKRMILMAIWALFVFCLITVTAGIAQAGTIEVFVSTGIRDEVGSPLRGDGGPTSDMVQLIYAGVDGIPNPPGVGGAATGDDVLLELETVMGQYYARIGSGFPFNPHEGKFHADFHLPVEYVGGKIYLRAWNASTVAESTHYGDSALYTAGGSVGEGRDFAPSPAESWSTNTEPPPGVGKDEKPPDNVTGFRAMAGNRQVTLTWTNPSGPANADFAGVFIRRKTGSYPTGWNDGHSQAVVHRNVETWTDVGLSAGTTYYYVAFAYDTSIPPNYACGTPIDARGMATPWASLAPGGGDGGGGGGCFIATAVYGTPLAEEVRILARFRDEYLLTNELGKRLVAFYYKYSPAWAEYVSGRKNMKALIEIGLRPLIWFSEWVVDDDKETIPNP